MTAVVGALRSARTEGLDAWMRRRVGYPQWAVLVFLLSWFFLGRGIDALTPIWSDEWAVNVWIVGSAFIVGLYCGRRRSFRTYEKLQDLVATADIVCVGVPHHPSFWTDLWIAIRFGDWRERILLGLILVVGVAGGLGLMLGDESADVWSLVALTAGCCSIAFQRSARVERFRQDVYEVAGTAGKDSVHRSIRQVVIDEIASLEARVKALKHLEVKLTESGGHIEVLEDIRATLARQHEAMASDGVQARRRDYGLAAASLLLGAVLSYVLQRLGLG